MRHLVLGLCVLTVSASAHAQNYLPSRDYSGPTTIVNMDVLQGGGGFAGPSAPILSMPLPPPEPIAPPMAVASLPSVNDGSPMALVPHNTKPVIHSSDLGELPPANARPAPAVEPSPFAPIKTVAIQPNERLAPSAMSEKDVFVTPSLSQTQKAVASSAPAKPILQEKAYGRSSVTEETRNVSAPMMVPDPVMPHDHGAVQPGLAVASAAPMPSASLSNTANMSNEDFEAYRLFFDGGSSELKPSEKAVLDKIVKKMSTDPSMRLRMQAYAAGTPETSGQARRLSLARAMKIRSYMTDKGVVATRLDVRALGMGSTELNDTAARSKAPADRVDVIFMRG